MSSHNHDAVVKEAEDRIDSIIKKSPELGSDIAARLSQLADEFEGMQTDEPALSPLEKIKQGFEKFKIEKSKNAELHRQLASGQRPKFMVIACSDSRVSPTTILGFQPGDAFVVRNVANLVPPYEKNGYPSLGAAVEYAILHLKVEHVLVIGHTKCGGINALIRLTPEDGNYSTTFIERWVEIGVPARVVTKSEVQSEDVDSLCKFCEKAAVKNSLSNLMTYPFVEDAVKKGTVSLHGAVYDLVATSFDLWNYES